jgi:tetratricopeptide (TPR) repeat protein
MSTSLQGSGREQQPRGQKPLGRWLLMWCLLLLLLAVGGYGGWLIYKRMNPVRQTPDMDAVLKANNRGIAFIERYQFQDAADAFEEAYKLDPQWKTGRINLGIALLNVGKNPNASDADGKTVNDRAAALFQSVLEEDARNPYANYCMGYLLLNNRNDMEKAAPYFEKVLEEDPNDAASWFWLGLCLFSDEPRAHECFEKAYTLDPYMNAILDKKRHMLAQEGKDKEADLIVREMDLLKGDGIWSWNNLLGSKWYQDNGKYAQVIGRVVDPGKEPQSAPIPAFHNEELHIALAPNTRWARHADFGNGPVAEVQKLIRQRFGAVLVVLDYDQDGKPDLFLLSAVVEDGKIRDLLLHNEGNGHFTDTTKKAGLADSRPSLACSVADFDNNGYPDLLITGAGSQHLFRNNGKGRFEDVTHEAGLDQLTSVCLGSAFLDLDQDGDLDLLVAQIAATPEQAIAVLNGDAVAKGAGVACFINIGEAPVQISGEDPPPLKPRFRRSDRLAGVWSDSLAAVGFAVADFDQDKDLDVLAIADRSPLAVAVNDRVMRFHKESVPDSLIPSGLWNGALVLDANRDERADLLLIGPEREPVLLLAEPVHRGLDAGKWFKAGEVISSPLIQAVAIDLDLDGWTDVVGLSKNRQPVLLHNDGRRLVQVHDAFGRDSDWNDNVTAVAVGDFRGQNRPDVLVWSEGEGLHLLANQDNGHHAVQFYLTGHRRIDSQHGGFAVRTNADGVGTWAIAQAGDHRTGLEYTTLSAGLGQSMQPIMLGLGPHEEPDFILLHWPDLCTQAAFNVTSDLRDDWIKTNRIEEINRKDTSCPILFTWNGERFVFVTDFLGAGSVGELESNGSTRPPRPEESVKIEAAQLKPLKGKYVLKLAEPMNEVTLIDRLQLVVMDHPADTRVFPDERFPGDGPPPTQDLLAFRHEIFPVKAVDHRGNDVTKTLREWDRDTVRDFAFRSWLGFAEEHWVELDFGDRLKEFGAKDSLILCLAGWTDYPYPDSIYAAEQAGIALLPPVLERQGVDGKWEKICEASFPAGLPRMMTLDVTGKLSGPSCQVRLRTNMQVFWDQIFVAPLEHRVPYEPDAKEVKGTDFLRVTALKVESAELSPKQCMLEYSPDGRQPTIYDYYRQGTNPVTVPAGRITRYGDVTELLTKTDDCFVIFGPGDELTVNFDATKLPPLPESWTRDFVLRTWGYCKDCAPFTATGDTIEPLPFRGMDAYPPQKTKYPDDALHNEYRKRYNTRPVGKTRK